MSKGIDCLFIFCHALTNRWRGQLMSWTMDYLNKLSLYKPVANKCNLVEFGVERCRLVWIINNIFFCLSATYQPESIPKKW